MQCTVHYSRVRVNIPSSLSRYYHQPCTALYCTVPYYNLNTPGLSSNITQPGYNQTKTRSGFLHFPMKKQLYFALPLSITPTQKKLDSFHKIHDQDSVTRSGMLKDLYQASVSAFVSQVWWYSAPGPDQAPHTGPATTYTPTSSHEWKWKYEESSHTRP